MSRFETETLSSLVKSSASLATKAASASGAAAAALCLALLAAPAPAQVVLGPSIVSPSFDGNAGNRTVAADLDQDGNVDLAYPRGGNIVVSFGDGAGHFGAAQQTTPAIDSLTLGLADLDGDGLLDRIAAPINMQPFGSSNFPPLELHVSRGLGGTAFDTADVYTLNGSSGMMSSGVVSVSDIDADGDLDVFVHVNDGAEGAGIHTGFDLLLNDGTGALTLHAMGGGVFALMAEAADLNQDGLPDLVYHEAGPSYPWFATHSVHVQFGQTGGGLLEVASWTDALLVDVADLDADGLQDILTWVPESSVRAQMNAGGGSFVAGPVSSYPSGRPITVADLDGDVYPDLFIQPGAGYGGPASWGAVSNDGTGGFDIWSMARANKGHTDFVIMADAVNGGQLDVVVAESVVGGTPILSVIENLTYPPSAPAQDLARSKSGSMGWPGTLTTSSFLPGQPLTLELWNAGANKPAFLILGLSEIYKPLKGGILVPNPDLYIGPVSTGSGTLSLHGTWPVGMPAGVALTMQWWMLDSGGSKGASASSAVRVVGG